MSFLNRFLILGLLSVMVAACGTATKQDETVPGDEQAQQDQRGAAQDEGTIAVSPFDDPANPLSKRTIYFEFDSYDLSAEDREVISAHAQYMAANPNAKVVLEGHADERGTREYNIALGERRAKAVAQLMLVQGVAQSQTDVISFGEERPAMFGSSEEAWERNRRVEIVYR